MRTKTCDARHGWSLCWVGLSVVGQIFQFLITFVIVLRDFIYALPELCSVVSDEIRGLQRLGLLSQVTIALRIEISGNSFLLTSR